MSAKAAKRHGEGAQTRRKLEGLAHVFAANLRLSKGGRAIDYPYWHIDLNAGCGWNAEAEREGSPLVFLRAAVASRRRVEVVFCDNHLEATHELSDRIASLVPQLAPGSAVRVVCRDNGQALADFGREIAEAERQQYAVGSALSDPNGYRVGFPADELADFTARLPRIDVVLNLNVNLFRSAIGCRRAAVKGFEDWPGVEDVLARLHRTHWLVRNILEDTPGHHFTLFVGRTTRQGYARSIDFHPLDSAEGQTILGLRRAEGVDQGSLFGD